ncbi:MAG: hypothetical protein ACM3ZB_03165 [bacterium]|jgi:hypothetical protein
MREAIRAKFGLDYVASKRTFVMGIDRRFAAQIAERFAAASPLKRAPAGASRQSNWLV